MIKCENCSAPCCRRVFNIPFLDGGDGVCKYLTSDNKCSIYEERPPLCNTDKMYEMKYRDTMSRAEYDELNKGACEILKIEDILWRKANGQIRENEVEKRKEENDEVREYVDGTIWCEDGRCESRSSDINC